MSTLPDTIFVDCSTVVHGADGKIVTGNTTQEQFHQALADIQANAVESVNINNLDEADPLQMLDLCEALMGNTSVKTLWICNCNVDTLGGKVLGQVLKANSTLTELNVETNRIGPKGMLALARGLKDNTALTVLRLENQSSPMGNKAERAFVKAVRAHKSLTKLAADFHETSSGNAVASAVSRNIDRARRARKKAASAAS